MGTLYCPGSQKGEKVLKIDRPLAGGFLGLTAAKPLRVVVAAYGHACGVHSEHDLKEQSDAQIIVSRFPFRGEGSEGS